MYRAEQPLLGRDAVIKVLHARHRATKQMSQRFLREAQLASKLDHPYAAHIYAFGVEQDGLMWIAMEYVKGRTLDDILAVRETLPLDELVPLLDRLCEVLQAAHDLGIIHRDIKPANVMVVERSGRAFPKLLDFGVAKLAAEPERPDTARPDTTPPPIRTEPIGAITVPIRGERQDITREPIDLKALHEADANAPDTIETKVAGLVAPDLTEAGARVGSPPYMAPEQWDDVVDSTSRTDLYALGVLAYEALVGQRPFIGPTMYLMALAHQNDPVPPVGGKHPIALDEVFRTVLAKRAADRYPSALAFAQAFRTAAGFGSQPLPALDDELRLSVESSLPQPIAEAVAAYHAAHNAHQGRDALRDVVSSAIRYIALVALAARAQVRVGDTRASESANAVIRDLRRRALRDDEWLLLAGELVAPFAARPDAHPMPELVTLLRGDSEVLTAAVEQRVDLDPLTTIHALLPHVTRLLRALAFLADYPLVAFADWRAESWMGVRRPRRIAVEITARSLEPNRPVLLDSKSRPLISLWPVMQLSPPMPGAAPELFLLDGRDRRGARMVALPQPLERHDDSLWDWLGEHYADPDRSTPAATITQEAKPYRGLASFTSQDADSFVGREREVDAAINRLTTASLLAVVGPSGAGKSSFVHAGVLPALPETWPRLSVRPGATPLATLQRRLAETKREPGTTLVLVVDQFEELFALGASNDECRAYVRELLAAASGEADTRVIITLRDDFLSRATQLPELRDRLPTALFLLGTPAPEDLVRILTQPLAQLGFELEDPQLAERMVADVVDTPGALALLSFTAAKLWELRDRHFRQLTRKAYDSLGGVAGALAQHAETTLAELSQHEQRLARVALLRLVTADGTRAILTRGELNQLMRDPAADAVIEKLIAARLLVTTESEGGDDRVEIIHEALLVAWPRFAEWRRENADGARLRDQVRAAARQWSERDRPRGLLWRDDAVTELKLWRARNPQPLTDIEEAFVAASLAEASRGRRTRRVVTGVVIGLMAVAVAVLLWARNTAATTAARDHARVLDQLVEQGRQAVLTGDSAAARDAFAEARRLGAHDSPALAFLERAAALPVEARRATLSAHHALVNHIEFSTDGTLLLTASEDGTARLWDVATLAERVTFSGCTDALFGAQLAAAHVATECSDGRVRIYALTGALEHDLATSGARTSRRQFSFARFTPDGRHLATLMFGVLEYWDVATGERLWTSGADPQARMALSPDGTTIAGMSAEKPLVTLWSAATGAVERTLALATPSSGALAFSAVAFTATGTLVTVGANAEIVQLWDPATGVLVGSLGEHGRIVAIAVSSDGKYVATALYDHSVQVWSLAAKTLALVLSAGDRRVSELAFSPKSDVLGAATSDGTVVLWDVVSGTALATLQGHHGTVWSLAFDRDGKQLVSGGADATAIVWDMQSPAMTHVSRLNAFVIDVELRDDRLLTTTDEAIVWNTITRQPVARHTIGSNGDARFITDSLVALLDNRGAVLVWDLTTDRVRELSHHDGPGDWVVTDHRDLVASWAGPELFVASVTRGVVFRTRAKASITAAEFVGHDALVVADADGNVAFYDGGGRVFRSVRAAGKVVALQVLPDGRFVTASPTVVEVWSAAGQRLRALAHPRGDITTIEVDHTGTVLATTGLDSTARLWSLVDYRQLFELQHPTYVSFPVFSSDDRLVATITDDGTVRAWDTSNGKELAHWKPRSKMGLLKLARDQVIVIDDALVMLPF